MEYNLEEDLRNSQIIKDKAKDYIYAQNLYAALSNNEWQKNEILPILEDSGRWYCSWRHAGRIASEIRNVENNYMEFYCSGIFNEEADNNGMVRESTITEEIRKDLLDLGWKSL